MLKKLSFGYHSISWEGRQEKWYRQCSCPWNHCQPVQVKLADCNWAIFQFHIAQHASLKLLLNLQHYGLIKTRMKPKSMTQQTSDRVWSVWNLGFSIYTARAPHIMSTNIKIHSRTEYAVNETLILGAWQELYSWEAITENLRTKFSLKMKRSGLWRATQTENGP